MINNKRKKRFSQITVRNQNDVNVAVQSNVDILITNSQNIDLIRNYDNSKFLIGSIKWEKFTTQDDILKEAIIRTSTDLKKYDINDLIKLRTEKYSKIGFYEQR